MAELSELIAQFLRVGLRFWQHVQGEQIAAETIRISVLRDRERGCRTDVSDLADDLMDSFQKRTSETGPLLKIGHELAVQMEARGEDSSGLLRFLNVIDCGGGPTAAAPLWGDLKVQLQRIEIKSRIRRKTAEGEGAAGADAAGPEQAPATPTREAVLGQLEPADRRAYYTYAYAELNLGTTTDRQAYQWLLDNGLPDERDSPELAAALAGYRLPSFAAWSRQLRNARRQLSEQKHTRRAGRSRGAASIVPPP